MFFGCSPQENHRKFPWLKPWVSIPSPERRHLLWVLWSHRQPRRPSTCGADLVGSTPRTTWVGAALPSQGEWHMTGDTLKMCHQNVASLKSPIFMQVLVGKSSTHGIFVPLPCWITGGFLWKCCESTEPVTGCWFFFPLLLGYVEEYHCIIVENHQPEIPEIEKTFYWLSIIILVKKCQRYRYCFSVSWASGRWQKWTVLRKWVQSFRKVAKVTKKNRWTTVSMSYVPFGLGKTSHVSCLNPLNHYYVFIYFSWLKQWILSKFWWLILKSPQWNTVDGCEILRQLWKKSAPPKKWLKAKNGMFTTYQPVSSTRWFRNWPWCLAPPRNPSQHWRPAPPTWPGHRKQRDGGIRMAGKE